MSIMSFITQCFGAKIVRVLFGLVVFLFVWFAVAAVVGSVMVRMFPASEGFLEDVVNWRNLPGSMLGIFAGAKAFRAIVRALEPKENTPTIVHKR
jgi:hypothetical protein